MYHRLYLTQVLLGYLFDLNNSNVSRIVRRLRPLLLAVLPVQETLLFTGDAQKPRRRVSTLDELFQKHPEFQKVLKGAAEQGTYKPKGKAKRQGNYSGKKKRHTLKMQVTTSRSGLLLHVSRAIAGKSTTWCRLAAAACYASCPLSCRFALSMAMTALSRTIPKDVFRYLTKPDATNRSTLFRNGRINFTTATVLRSNTLWLISSGSSS